MSIGNFIIVFFTSREWASITLIALLILFTAKSNSIVGVLKAFFHWKILLPIACAQIYLSIFAYLLYLFGLWNITVLRETIFFLFYTSIALIFKYNSNSQRIASVKGIVEDTIKASFIIGFYLNIYTFSYGVELILQFLLAFFFLMGVYNKRETKEKETVYGCTQTFFYCLSFALFTYSIYMSINQWKDNFSKENVISLLFPMVATIAYWPFLYLFAVIKAYEEWLVHVSFASNEDTYTFRRNTIMRACGINLSLINFVSKNLHVYIPQTKDNFLKDLNNSIEKYKIKKAA